MAQATCAYFMRRSTFLNDSFFLSQLPCLAKDEGRNLVHSPVSGSQVRAAQSTYQSVSQISQLSALTSQLTCLLIHSPVTQTLPVSPLTYQASVPLNSGLVKEASTPEVAPISYPNMRPPTCKHERPASPPWTCCAFLMGQPPI
eukprot:1159120-Pelagomonas_calceolata.AAC.4